jgi:hypothetical protein
MSKDVQGSCGTCVVCCQWLDIESEELSKKAGILCEHCVGSGCGIYETRPQVCRGFFCGYRLISQLGEEWRPDRCGVLIQAVEKNLPPQYTGAQVGFNFIVLGGDAAVLRPGLADYLATLVKRNVAVYLSADSPKTLINEHLRPYVNDPAAATRILLHLYHLHLEAKQKGWVPK